MYKIRTMLPICSIIIVFAMFPCNARAKEIRKDIFGSDICEKLTHEYLKEIENLNSNARMLLQKAHDQVEESLGGEATYEEVEQAELEKKKQSPWRISLCQGLKNNGLLLSDLMDTYISDMQKRINNIGNPRMLEYESCSRSLDTGVKSNLALTILMADINLQNGCLDTAEMFYRSVIQTYVGLSFTGYRDRAKLGLEDIKSRRLPKTEIPPESAFIEKETKESVGDVIASSPSLMKELLLKLGFSEGDDRAEVYQEISKFLRTLPQIGSTEGLRDCNRQEWEIISNRFREASMIADQSTLAVNPKLAEFYETSIINNQLGFLLFSSVNKCYEVSEILYKDFVSSDKMKPAQRQLFDYAIEGVRTEEK